MLLCFTSSHRTASFDLLERLERRADDVRDALAERGGLVSGTVLLATCNRFEAYLDVDDSAARAVAEAGVLDTVAAAAGVPADELRTSSVVLHDEDVAAHLFSVSSGLESVVVGEGEIAGQVRRALSAARRGGRVTRDLELLFQSASRTSRGVKNNTALGGAGRSIVRLALDLAASRITDWSAARVLLVGTGSYAGASLAALRDRGATNVVVYSRSGRAEKFAASHGIVAVPADGLEAAIAAADLVVTCSVAPSVIIDRSLLERALGHDDALERRLIIDLGLPRNVEMTVTELDGVELLDLETIRLHAPLTELSAQDDALAIVGSAADEFHARRAGRDVEPALVALRAHIFDVLDAEIERGRRRGDDDGRVEAALRHLAGVLLHTPSVRARSLAREGQAELFSAGVSALFGVEAAEAALAPLSLDEARERPAAERPDVDDAAVS